MGSSVCFCHLPFGSQRAKTMTAKSTSAQLLELIGEFERSATEILRKDLCHLTIRHVLNKMGPKLKIEVTVVDILEVR